MTSTSFSLRSPASFPFPLATGACGHVRWAQPLARKPFRSPLPPAATPAVVVPRRLLLPAAAGVWDFLSGGAGGAAAATLAVRRGMQLFKQGDVAGSVAEFDRAIELDPRQKAYLWQRGLSLYYLDRCINTTQLVIHSFVGNALLISGAYELGLRNALSTNFFLFTRAAHIFCFGWNNFVSRFEDAAEQFRLDVAENPNDTEESIWCFLCEAQLYGVEEARKRFLELSWVVRLSRACDLLPFTVYPHEWRMSGLDGVLDYDQHLV